MPALARNILATVLALGVALPLAAEVRSTPFMDLMGPLFQIDPAGLATAMPSFTDYRAAADVAVRAAEVVAGVEPTVQRSVWGALTDAPPGTDWTGRVGFARGDVLAEADFGSYTADATVLLIHPDTLPAIGPALLANGYALSEDRGYPAYWRGEADNTIDLANRAADDPFAFSVPKSSRIAVWDGLLLQTASWPALDALMAAAGPDPTLAALGDALDLPDWGDHRVLQAILYGDPTALAAGSDPGAGVAVGGMPLWSMLMLADLGNGASDLTLVMLVFSDKGDAEAAAQTMAAGMADLALPSAGDGVTLGDLIGTGRALVAGDGPYVAIYAVETAPQVRNPTLIENRGYSVLTRAILRRELSLLAPVLP